MSPQTPELATARRLPTSRSRSQPRRAVILGLAAAAALFLFFPAIPALITDWWWFQEIGYQIVFTRTLIARVLLFFLAGGLAAGLLYLNLRIAQRGLVANPTLLQVADSAPRLNLTVALRRFSTPAALDVGLVAGLAGAASWDRFLPALYGSPFGIADPVFSRDIGSTSSPLPALSAALGFLVTLTIVSLVLVTLLYGVRGDLAPERRSRNSASWRRSSDAWGKRWKR
jgi:uncharacterized protein